MALSQVCNCAISQYSDIPSAVTCCSVMYSCFCPCIVLGQLHALQRRRKPIQVLPDGYIKVGFGNDTLSTCALTGLYCCICWPLSPFLGFHLHSQRETLRLVYGETENLESMKSVYRCCSTSLSWPCVVTQHQYYLFGKYRQGILRFDWEDEVIEDILRPRPQLHTIIVSVVGSKYPGKSLFVRKLLNYASSEVSPVETDLVGFKTIGVSESSIDFLEVWDLSDLLVESTSMEDSENKVVDDTLILKDDARRILDICEAIVFHYDATDVTSVSFHEMSRIFECSRNLLSSKKLYCVALVDVKRMREEHEVIKMGKRWSNDNSMDFHLVSVHDDHSVAELRRQIQAKG